MLTSVPFLAQKPVRCVCLNALASSLMSWPTSFATCFRLIPAESIYLPASIVGPGLRAIAVPIMLAIVATATAPAA